MLRLKNEEAIQLTGKVNGFGSDIEELTRRLRENESVSSRNVDSMRAERDELLRKVQEWESKWRQGEQSN